MLRAVAAAAATRMPKLEVLEIWNARDGLASLFRYQLTWGEWSSAITWGEAWDFVLRPPVVQAWQAVALAHRGRGLLINEESLDAGAVVKSYGDAIHHLKLMNQVIRPVSLQQIRMEYRIREGVQNG